MCCREKNRTRPAVFIRGGGELALSGASLQELMEAVLARRASFRFRAKGSSMAPFIENNDVITVAPLHGASIRSGDVVAFTQPETGQLKVHRVIAKREDAFLLMGDNASRVDGRIPLACIQGLVTQLERKGREVRLASGPRRLVISLLARFECLDPLLHLVLRFFSIFQRKE